MIMLRLLLFEYIVSKPAREQGAQGGAYLGLKFLGVNIKDPSVSGAGGGMLAQLLAS